MRLWKHKPSPGGVGGSLVFPGKRKIFFEERKTESRKGEKKGGKRTENSFASSCGPGSAPPPGSEANFASISRTESAILSTWFVPHACVCERGEGGRGGRGWGLLNATSF